MNENIMNENIMNEGEETTAYEEGNTVVNVIGTGLLLTGAVTVMYFSVRGIKKAATCIGGMIHKVRGTKTDDNVIDIPNEVGIGQDLEEV